jgi:hypothetical protein
MFRLLGRWRRITLFTMCKRLTESRAPTDNKWSYTGERCFNYGQKNPHQNKNKHCVLSSFFFEAVHPSIKKAWIVVFLVTTELGFLQTTACCCMLLHTAAYYCILLHTTAYYCILLRRTAAYCCILLHTAAYCCILLHTAAYCCILLHTAAYCCILLHTAPKYNHQSSNKTELWKGKL